jgi:hypothetical protein
MIRKIALAILFAASFPLFAQFNIGFPSQSSSNISLSDFDFGIKISPSVSWLNINHEDLQAGGATMKFSAGIVASYDLTPLLSIISGLNYINNGGYAFDSASLTSTMYKQNYKINYNMIEMPLGLKLETKPVRKTSYFIQGGGTAGFMINATEKHFSQLSSIPDKKEDIYALSHYSNVGYFAGVGINYQLTRSIGVFTEMNYKSIITSTANRLNYEKEGRYVNKGELGIMPGNLEISFGIMF